MESTTVPTSNDQTSSTSPTSYIATKTSRCTTSTSTYSM
jgi:hypothetical protein